MAHGYPWSVWRLGFAHGLDGPDGLWAEMAHGYLGLSIHSSPMSNL